MDLKKEEKKEVDLKQIRTDFLKRRLNKNDKNSFDIISMFHHILSLSDNNNFVRNNFERLKDIVSRGCNQQELNSFIEEIKSDETFKQIKDIDLGEGYTPESFLSEYGSSLPTFLGDFDKITNVENSLDFETLDYTCSRDLMAEMWPEYSEELAKYDQAYMAYKDNELGFGAAEAAINEKVEDIERYNRGIDPENSFEIRQDMATVATTAGVLAFPPLVIVSGILFLLKANKNKLVEKTTNWIAKKKKNAIESSRNKIKQKTGEEMNKFKKVIDERKNRAQELKSSLPESWKKIVESVTPPNMHLYDRLINLKKHKEQLTHCSTDIDGQLIHHQPHSIQL